MIETGKVSWGLKLQYWHHGIRLKRDSALVGGTVKGRGITTRGGRGALLTMKQLSGCRKDLHIQSRQ